MSFQSRKAKFAEITGQFQCERPSSFIAVHQINPDLYDNLRTAVAIYISRFMHSIRIILDDRLLVENFAVMHKKGEILNCTPNGLMVPKRHVTLEYNGVVKAYFQILKNLGIEKYILTMNPPSVRFKESLPDFDSQKMERGYASEKIHSDAWTGDCPSSINVSIPLFGDTERNRVVWYSVPDNFQEEWLNYRPSYDHGDEIAAHYQERVNYPYSKGKVYITDVAVLHCTTREKNAGPRFSIDNLFTITPPPESFDGRIGKKYSDLMDIREKNLLVSQLGLGEIIQNSPNRLPLDLELVQIL